VPISLSHDLVVCLDRSGVYRNYPVYESIFDVIFDVWEVLEMTMLISIFLIK